MKRFIKNESPKIFGEKMELKKLIEKLKDCQNQGKTEILFSIDIEGNRVLEECEIVEYEPDIIAIHPDTHGEESYL